MVDFERGWNWHREDLLPTALPPIVCELVPCTLLYTILMIPISDYKIEFNGLLIRKADRKVF